MKEEKKKVLKKKLIDKIKKHCSHANVKDDQDKEKKNDENKGLATAMAHVNPTIRKYVMGIS